MLLHGFGQPKVFADAKANLPKGELFIVACCIWVKLSMYMHNGSMACWPVVCWLYNTGGSNDCFYSGASSVLETTC